MCYSSLCFSRTQGSPTLWLISQTKVLNVVCEPPGHGIDTILSACFCTLMPRLENEGIFCIYGFCKLQCVQNVNDFEDLGFFIKKKRSSEAIQIRAPSSLCSVSFRFFEVTSMSNWIIRRSMIRLKACPYWGKKSRYFHTLRHADVCEFLSSK